MAQHFRLLLELGAEVEGSPASERLHQLFSTYWAVSPLLRRCCCQRTPACYSGSVTDMAGCDTLEVT